jgi:hypothetical protein
VQSLDVTRSVIAGETTCEEQDFEIEIVDAVPGFVQIQPDGLGLLHIVERYYPSVQSGGGRRLQVARSINEHPLNRGLHVPAQQQYTRDNIGAEVISFFPTWYREPGRNSQRYLPGSAHAVIYLESLS